jgi:hypothetical protein
MAIERKLPDCPKCGAAMERHFNNIRCPEVWLRCPACKHVVDVEPDDYFANRLPKWFLL